jgi:uncharacterized SAM-binding protein YcdF (DUF218 family)
MSSTMLPGRLLRMNVLHVPPALSEQDLAELKRSAAKGGPPTAIVVLGAGRRVRAPEYGFSTLSPLSMERLRYGLWLGRETGLPVAFTGGVGHGSPPGATEAEIAARIAEKEFGRPLKWIEDRSRDTTENGLLTVPPLQAAGIQRIVLVTSDFHMQRALRAFERSVARSGVPMQIMAAPMGLRPAYDWEWQDNLPSGAGFQDTRWVLHEWLGWIAGS